MSTASALTAPGDGSWLTTALGESTAARRASDLASRLTANDLDVRLLAVREAFSLAGVATVTTAADGSQSTMVPAVQPAASAVVSRIESFQLARDLPRPGTPWNAYAESLYALGWPDSQQPQETAGYSLWGQLAAFASYAAAVEGDEPSAVTWLLIPELSQARGECTDWNAVEDPSVLTIGTLEQLLISFEFDRAIVGSGVGGAS